VHIIPRRAGDGFDIPLPFGGSQMPDRTVLDAYAARIIAALTDPMRIETKEPGQARAATDAAKKRVDGGIAPKSSEPSRDRSVALPVYDESGRSRPSSSTPARDERSERRWRVREGAHGELLYEPNVDTTGTDDAA
jgi:hypothetical protein